MAPCSSGGARPALEKRWSPRKEQGAVPVAARARRGATIAACAANGPRSDRYGSRSTSPPSRSPASIHHGSAARTRASTAGSSWSRCSSPSATRREVGSSRATKASRATTPPSRIGFVDQESDVLTVLFTDWSGSTSLLSSLGDDAADELRRSHFSLLRSAITAHRGREVKNLGDGLMVSFSSAREAVACGAAMQQAVSARSGQPRAARRHRRRRADPRGRRPVRHAGRRRPPALRRRRWAVRCSSRTSCACSSVAA